VVSGPKAAAGWCWNGDEDKCPQQRTRGSPDLVRPFPNETPFRATLFGSVSLDCQVTLPSRCIREKHNFSTTHTVRIRYSTIKVIERITLHSVTLPFLTTTLVSLTQAPSIPVTVSDALAIPLETASSIPLGEPAMTSITFAIANCLSSKKFSYTACGKD